jgi:diguanylate cyclase (GGDEF)-like protein
MQPATVLGLTMIAACWLGVTYILSIEDSKSVEGAVQQGANLARLVEENIVSTLNGIDRALLLLREAYERDPDHFDLRDWTKRAIVTDLTLRLSVVGADGFLLGTTRLGAGDVFEPVYLGDREYFLAQVDAKTDDAFIGKPVTGRFSGRSTAQISRRLRHPDGSFAGTITAALDSGSVEGFFGTVDLGPRGTALLRTRDGVILASRGFREQVVGRQVMPAVLRNALARAPSGYYWGRGAIERVNRLVSYRTPERFPLLVSVGLAEDFIFESYWRNRATYLTIASLVTMLVLIAIAAGIRHQLRLDDIRDDLRRSEAQARRKARELEVTLDHMGQGIIMTDADNHVPVINRRAVELLGLPDSFRSRDNGEPLGPEAGDLLVADAPAPENTVYQRTTANGVVLEFHRTSLPDGGSVRTITDITERQHAEQEIVRLAHHDALTGLANRNLLHRRIEQAISREKRLGCGFALLCVDLDRFKIVNDTLGHSVGDELLCQFAERLTGCARDLDTVARIGGDEFVVLQASVDGMDEAGALAGRIQQRACVPYSVAGNHMTIGISIGIALAPQDGANVDQLLGNADLALYRAKAGGRNTFCFFNADIEKAVLERHRLERELPAALEKGEFELFYQPWITFADGIQRLRGAAAMAPSGARHHRTCRIHLDRRGHRRDRTARRMGVAPRLPQCGWLAANHQGRREPVGSAIHGWRSLRHRHGGAGGVGPAAAAARAGDHRDASTRPLRGHARNAASVGRPRRQHCARRLRHGILVADLSASVPLRPHQDRSDVRRRNDDAFGLRRDRCGGGGARPQPRRRHHGGRHRIAGPTHDAAGGWLHPRPRLPDLPAYAGERHCRGIIGRQCRHQQGVVRLIRIEPVVPRSPQYKSAKLEKCRRPGQP